MKITPLASGSKGNSFLIETGHTSILIDAGLSAKQLSLRLRDTGSDASRINALFITHEHIDHISGVRVFAKQCGIPVYMNEGCRIASMERYALHELGNIHLFETGVPFDFQDVIIHPLCVSHDTSDPVCFHIGDGKHDLGIVTDLGKVSTLITTHLRKMDALILEANHDTDMLKINPRYPEKVKQRIRSRFGHLSNSQSAECARDIILKGKLRHLMLAHLSEQNNSEEKATQTFRSLFEEAGIDLPFSFARQQLFGPRIIL